MAGLSFARAAGLLASHCGPLIVVFDQVRMYLHDPSIESEAGTNPFSWHWCGSVLAIHSFHPLEGGYKKSSEDSIARYCTFCLGLDVVYVLIW